MMMIMIMILMMIMMIVMCFLHPEGPQTGSAPVGQKTMMMTMINTNDQDDDDVGTNYDDDDIFFSRNIFLYDCNTGSSNKGIRGGFKLLVPFFRVCDKQAC